MTIKVTLTTAGDNTGPFNLYSNIDGFVSPFATNVSKAELLAGYPCANVPDGTIIIRVKSSNSKCNNYEDIVITTTTTTTTALSYYIVDIYCGEDCNTVVDTMVVSTTDPDIPIDTWVLISEISPMYSNCLAKIVSTYIYSGTSADLVILTSTYFSNCPWA